MSYLRFACYTSGEGPPGILHPPRSLSVWQSPGYGKPWTPESKVCLPIARQQFVRMWRPDSLVCPELQNKTLVLNSLAWCQPMRTGFRSSLWIKGCKVNMCHVFCSTYIEDHYLSFVTVKGDTRGLFTGLFVVTPASTGSLQWTCFDAYLKAFGLGLMLSHDASNTPQLVMYCWTCPWARKKTLRRITRFLRELIQ